MGACTRKILKSVLKSEITANNFQKKYIILLNYCYSYFSSSIILPYLYIEHFIGDLQVYREKWDSCIFVSKDLSSSYISDFICVYINNKIYILF